MSGVQVAESIKLEKTELEFEVGQLTGQVERLQARIRTLIEEQVIIVPQIYLQLHLLDSFFRLFKLLVSRLLAKILAFFHCANAYKICTMGGRKYCIACKYYHCGHYLHEKRQVVY